MELPRKPSNRDKFRREARRPLRHSGSGSGSAHIHLRPTTGGNDNANNILENTNTMQNIPLVDTSGPTAPREWAQLQVCDAISCTTVGRPLPPHMGLAVDATEPLVDSRPAPPLPWSRWMKSRAKNHFVASLGEFTGTTMFLFIAFGATEIVLENPYPVANEIIKLLYISISFGFSLMVNAWVFFRISGALFNPAVTLAMLLVGALGPCRALCLFVSQLAGAIAASAMVLGCFPTKLRVNTTLSPQTSLARGVWIEALLTSELVFTILMLAKEKHRSTFMAPVGIGLALFISQMVGVFYTGGSLNPARSFGPALVTNTFEGDHWIYWVGPFMGTLIAVAFYKFIKLLEYEMANPGQDAEIASAPMDKVAEDSSQMPRMPTRVLRLLGLDTRSNPQKPIDEEQPAANQAGEAPASAKQRGPANSATASQPDARSPPSLRATGKSSRFGREEQSG